MTEYAFLYSVLPHSFQHNDDGTRPNRALTVFNPTAKQNVLSLVALLSHLTMRYPVARSRIVLSSFQTDPGLFVIASHFSHCSGMGCSPGGQVCVS